MAKKNSGKTAFQVDVEILKQEVNAIQESVKRLKESGIRESLLFHAIQQNAGTLRGRPVPMSHVRAIIDGLEDIESYIFPTEDEE